MICIAFNPFFNLPENHLHENGLRANPPAKYTPEGYGKKHHANHKHQRGQHKQEDILGPENLPQDYELPVHEI